MSLSPAQRDAMAKQMGFKSYQEWQLWNAQQERKNNPAAKPKVRNVMQNAVPPAKKKSGHPLGYVADRVLGATKK